MQRTMQRCRGVGGGEGGWGYLRVGVGVGGGRGRGGREEGGRGTGTRRGSGGERGEERGEGVGRGGGAIGGIGGRGGGGAVVEAVRWERLCAVDKGSAVDWAALEAAKWVEGRVGQVEGVGVTRTVDLCDVSGDEVDRVEGETIGSANAGKSEVKDRDRRNCDALGSSSEFFSFSSRPPEDMRAEEEMKNEEVRISARPSERARTGITKASVDGIQSVCSSTWNAKSLFAFLPKHPIPYIDLHALDIVSGKKPMVRGVPPFVIHKRAQMAK